MHSKIVNIHMVQFNYMFQKEIGDSVAHVLLSSAGLDQLKKTDSPWPIHGCYCTTCPADGFGKTYIHMVWCQKRHIFTCRF